MLLTRKEDISLYLYLKDILIAPQFYEINYEYPLVNTAVNTWDLGYEAEDYDGASYICPFKRENESGYGRGLIYFQITASGTCDFGTEQTDLVRIYNGSTVASGYQVNYKTGQIITTEDLTNYIADYYWNYPAVIDAWPYEDVPELPIVSLELQEGGNLPLQLGGGNIRNASWNIEIFGRNKGDRDDLMDIIFDGLYLKRCPIYLLPSGLPLTQRGFYNSQFSTEMLTDYKYLVFEDINKSLTGLPQWGFYQSEIVNRFRASLSFTTQAYKG